MEKKEIKSVIIRTLIVLMIITLFLFCLVSLINPKFISEKAADVGLDKMSLSFQIAEYNRTENINDLGIVMNKAISLDDNDVINKYGLTMINNVDYEEYSTFVDKNVISSIEYMDYIESFLLLSLYESGEIEQVEAILSSAITKRYTKYGIGASLSRSIVENDDMESGKLLLGIYERNYEIAKEEQQHNIAIEAEILASAFGIDEEIWKERTNIINS